MTAKSIVEIILGVLGLGTATVVLLQKIKEAKARKTVGLKGNPTRCIEEAARITALESWKGECQGTMGELNGKVDGLITTTNKILELHLKP